MGAPASWTFVSIYLLYGLNMANYLNICFILNVSDPMQTVFLTKSMSFPDNELFIYLLREGFFRHNYD